MTEQVTVCLRPSEGVQLFHLHNNEVGSEVFDRVCLPSTCAHVLMDSVLHYFADPGLSQRPQLQRNRAGSKGACVSVRLLSARIYQTIVKLYRQTVKAFIWNHLDYR